MSTAFPEWMQIEDMDLEADEPLTGYPFYDGSVILYFEPGPHTYFKYNEKGDREDIDGCTTVLNVISKPYLMPWATKLCIETLKERMFDSSGMPVKYSTEELMAWFEEAKNKHKEKLEIAGDIGHIAHKSLEINIKHAIANTGGIVESLVDLPTDEKAYNCVQAAYGWCQAHNVRWLHTEKLVYSRLYNVAGTLDGDAIVDSCLDPLCLGCRGEHWTDRRAIIDFKSSNQLSDSYAYQVALYQFAFIEEFGEVIPDRWVLRLGKTLGDFQPWHISSAYFEADLAAFLAALELYRSLKEIEQRRKVERKAFTELVRGIKKEAKAVIKLQEKGIEKATKLVAKAEIKAAKALKLASQKAHYKALRGQGESVEAAKALAYPVEVAEAPAQEEADAECAKELSPLAYLGKLWNDPHAPVVKGTTEKPDKFLPQQTSANEWSL